MDDTTKVKCGICQRTGQWEYESTTKTGERVYLCHCGHHLIGGVKDGI